MKCSDVVEYFRRDVGLDGFREDLNGRVVGVQRLDINTHNMEPEKTVEQ